MSSNRYLLDTNILVFFIGDKSRLSKKNYIHFIRQCQSTLHKLSLCSRTFTPS